MDQRPEIQRCGPYFRPEGVKPINTPQEAEIALRSAFLKPVDVPSLKQSWKNAETEYLKDCDAYEAIAFLSSLEQQPGKPGQFQSVVVATSSPAKLEEFAQIAKETGIPFQPVLLPEVADEYKHQNPEERFKGRLNEYVEMAADSKLDAASQLREGSPAIAVDIIVICDERVLEKPADINQARKMIQSVSGKNIEVAVSIAARCRTRQGIDRRIHRGLRVDFQLNRLTDQEVENYLQHMGNGVLAIAGGIDYSSPQGKSLINPDIPLSLLSGQNDFTDVEPVYLEFTPPAFGALDSYFRGVPTHLIQSQLARLQATYQFT